MVEQRTDINMTLDERRNIRDHGHRISEGMEAVIAMWRPLIQFNAAILRSFAEGFEAIAINLDRYNGGAHKGG
jgi:hypothetical protein